MAERKLIEGTIVEMGGEDYVIPPLNFSAVKKIAAKAGQLKGIVPGSIPDAEQMDIIVEVIHLAIKRNYPDMTAEQLEDLLDLRNAATVVNAIMAGSGFVQQGE